MILVLMGVSGVGKTTVGKLLSTRTGWLFEDADDYHSEANRKKMASGTPLTDEDRLPWLHTLHARMVKHLENNEPTILACSALRAQARKELSRGLREEQMKFVLLYAAPELIEQRILARQHQYMNPKLLPSQLATLEEPGDAWRVSVAGTPEETVAEIIRRLNETRVIAGEREKQS
uniref:gluconokinase n=1 Tax=mine drainage metagenome TaxID=410659 RepID=E6PXH9_9ZZZZ